MPTAVPRQAQKIIANHPHFRGRAEAFEFEERDEILVVRGRVPTFYLKQLLQDALKHLDGVHRIDNRVKVVAPDGLSSVADPR